MKDIKILIVEDDFIIAESIGVTLSNYGFRVVGIAHSGEEALNLVKVALPEIILMDINLSGEIDGIETAEIVNKQYPIVAIIFITALGERHVFKKALGIFPQNYLTKPFSEPTLLNAVEIAAKNLELNSEKRSRAIDAVFVYHNNGYSKVFLKDVLYIQADGAYCNLYTQKESDMTLEHFRFSLSANRIVEQLLDPDIVRVSKSFYVNVNKIVRIHGSFLIVGNYEISISKTYREELLKRVRFVSTR